jgi:hypothetical protein
MAEHVSYKDCVYWREQISLKNVEMGFPPITALEIVDGRQRLLSRFTAEVVPLLSENGLSDLEKTIRRWVEGFDKVVNKLQFNHWDNSDASSKANPMTGFGWTSTMLEYCRAAGRLRYIRTGRKEYDFAIIAAEVSLGISSKSNPFQPGRQDYIEPDGIGVREVDGSFLVLEMKGPQDDHDLLSATFQALCGALAMFAKREMIVRLAKSKGKRRPALAHCEIPSDRSTIGLHIMLVLKSGEQLTAENVTDIEPSLIMLMKAFRPLREVVYFIVGQDQFGSTGSLQTTRAYSKIGDEPFSLRPSARVRYHRPCSLHA